MEDKRILDIGCGRNIHPGTVRLDISPDVAPDVVHDLNVFPYPFEDNRFDHVTCNHVIEHITDTVKFMEEIHRILTPGGVLYIVTPHFSSSNSWTDPTHKHHFGLFSFDFFCEGEGKVDYYSNIRFRIKHRRIDFHKRFKLFGIEWFANRHPRSWEKYYCFRYPGRNITIYLETVK